MNNAEIYSIGNELVEGKETDTNSAFLSRLLIENGFTVKGHRTLPDDEQDIMQALKDAVEQDIHVVAVTGGLGPTIDDITRECVARAFGRKLVFDDKAWNMLSERMRKFGKEPSENNRKQAFIPEGADVFYNTRGTAPGFGLNMDGTRFCVMPGIPEEMKNMALCSFVPYLEKEFELSSGPIEKYFKTIGIGESETGARLEDIMERGRNPRVDLTVQAGIMTVKLVAMPGTESCLIEKDAEAIRERLGMHIWAEENIRFEEYVVHALRERRLSLSLAESCTGGLAAAGLVSVPGCSEVFIEGIVAYSNSSKISRLGVNPDSIETYGAVSEIVAREMAEGIRSRSGTDISGAVTGIAGPDGGAPDKPAGTVWLCTASKKGMRTELKQFHGDREYVRKRSVTALYAMIRECILV